MAEAPLCGLVRPPSFRERLLQGYLAHKKQPPPPQDHHRAINIVLL